MPTKKNTEMENIQPLLLPDEIGKWFARYLGQEETHW